MLQALALERFACFCFEWGSHFAEIDSFHLGASTASSQGGLQATAWIYIFTIL